MVLRAIIVLPIYLVIIFFAPSLAILQPLANAIEASGNQSPMLHAIGYGIAIPVSLALAALCSRGERHYNYGVFARIAQMTLLGIAVMSTYQLFLYFTDSGMQIFAFLIPVAFCIGETAYELFEYGRNVLRG
jgi:hypothetical protein